MTDTHLIIAPYNLSNQEPFNSGSASPLIPLDFVPYSDTPIAIFFCCYCLCIDSFDAFFWWFLQENENHHSAILSDETVATVEVSFSIFDFTFPKV